MRLDRDMASAIEKLALINRLLQSLPGQDCGLCGSPTCAALAEDVVMERASADACRRKRGESQ
jgi:Na+-translocating ferredoxin:NAD+ oxidoreductase RNF subunit RnfB